MRFLQVFRVQELPLRRQNFITQNFAVLAGNVLIGHAISFIGGYFPQGYRELRVFKSSKSFISYGMLVNRRLDLTAVNDLFPGLPSPGRWKDLLC